MQKKYLLIGLVFLFCPWLVSFVHAGKLLSQEAINYYNEGVRAQKAQNFTAAETFFQKAELLDPEDPRCIRALMNNRAIKYVKEGELEEAQKIFEDLVKMYPDNKQARLNLGLIYEKTKSRLESLEYWVKLFDMEGLKPTNFVVEDEIKPDKAK